MPSTTRPEIQAGRRRDAETWVRLVVGAIFVPAGLVKFLAYGWELDAFERFGLPVAPAWVIAAGVIEVLGAIALLANRFVVPWCVLLAVTMAVAVGVSGFGAGDVIPSLTLAPALLLGLLFLLWRAWQRRDRLA